MSYILDALKKSEDERRSSGDLPGLHAVHDTVNTSPSFWRKKPIWIGALLLVLLTGVVLGWWFVRGLTDSALMNTREDSARSPLVKSDRTELAIEGLNRLNRPETTEEDAANRTAFSKNSSDTEISELYQSAVGRKASDQVDGALDVAGDGSVSLGQDSEESAVNQEVSGIDNISDLPSHVLRELPTIDVSAHIYSSFAGKGFAIINGAKTYSGGHIGRDVFLEKIEQDTLVFSYRGYFFRMDAMSSWQKAP